MQKNRPYCSYVPWKLWPGHTLLPPEFSTWIQYSHDHDHADLEDVAWMCPLWVLSFPHKCNPGCTIITCSVAGQHATLVNQMQIGSSWRSKAKLPRFNSYPMAIPCHFCYFTSQGYVLYYTTTERSYVDIIFIGALPTVKMTQITCLQTNNNYAWIPSVMYSAVCHML